MQLTSTAYLVFLAAAFFLYWLLVRWRLARLALILLANYWFYALWDLSYLALIPTAGLLDYLAARGMAATRQPLLRGLLLLLSLAVNLGLMASLKFLPVWNSQWPWLLPLPLSFYCFQALSYTLDVYRKDTKPTSSLLAHLTALSLFPTIIAGPIARPASLLPQLEKPKPLDALEGSKALFLIAVGAIKKLLVADYLAENLVNRIFDFPTLYSGLEVLAGVYGYALQLYFDFSGYSDVALGSALLLGIKLPQNFNMPYAANNIAAFWQRWHISLSTWLRDYVYFSFPKLRTAYMPHFALIVTMVLGGLWHGATWNFLIWGALHGLGLSACRAWQAWRSGNTWNSPLSRGLATFWTFHFVCLGWVFFRATTLENALTILQQISSLTLSAANLSGTLLAIAALAVLGHCWPQKSYEKIQNAFAHAPVYAQAAILALLAYGIEYVAATGSAPFVYSQF
ncbi:MAG: MBOAT family O-acyltransferase [Bryobacter sp.]|nr:MBOAT family O-acyltransferase [Bryobacter sp.]